MKYVGRTFLLFVLLFSWTLAFAQSSVWKISSGGQHSYIGGTFHLLAPEDHPLPSAYDVAYKDSNSLVFETDIGGAASPDFQARFIAALTFGDGRTLKSALSESTYKKLSTYFSSRNLDIAQFSPFTPSGASLMMVMTELQLLGLRPELGVDMVYSNKAQKDKKQLSSLESLDEQLGFIANMSHGKDDELILYTLRDIKQLPEMIKDMKLAWKNGDLKNIDKITADTAKDFPEVHKALIVDRNNNWMKKIEPMIKSTVTEFILVGTAHLSGESGLINQLKKKGYKVEQLK